ncbi:hypothetical protein BC830DRAFT_1120151 [Chytriomyces sp. MP71]|nr:hypothetical protein BC830DRAFT_1120151 [Chytriomyces sp. MP71]
MSERGKSSNTLALLYGSRQNAPASSGYAVLRLSGFCTGFSADDVARLFARNSGVEIDAAFSAPLFTNRIHFPIDCQTGYAPKECFVEFPTFTDALAALDFSAETIIDGRCVICRWSSQIELRDALFPSIRKESADRENTKYASSVLGKRGTTVFLERKDINGMILLCKEAKTRFPGSSIIKPFRAVVSILCKVPWNLAHSLSPIHRDHIFEMFKLSFEAAQCLSQEKDSLLPSSIVEQMVRCALCVPGFTEKQKHAILALTVTTYFYMHQNSSHNY